MRLKSWLLPILFAALPLVAQKAIKLDPIADINLAFRKGSLVVEVPEGAHLKIAFMDVKLGKGAPGKLQVGPLPPASAQDELGDGIWHGAVKIPLKGDGLSGEVPLVITYQPCTEGKGGVCFPPTDRTLKVKASEIPAAKAKAEAKAETRPEAISTPAPPSLEPAPTPIASPTPKLPAPAKESLLWALLAAFGWGLVASLTPCVYPMIPITMAIVGAKGSSRFRGFLLSLSLVLGMAVTYTSLGIAAGLSGTAFGSVAQRPGFLIPVSLLFAAFALSLFGAFEIQLPQGLQAKLQGNGPRRGFSGAFVMGLVLGPLAAPCVGPFVGTVLLNITQHQGIASGALQLFVFALGMGVLFMAAGTFSAALPRSGNWLIKLKQAMGVVVLGFAAWNIRNIVPEWANFAMWSAVLLSTAAVLEAFSPAEGLAPSIRKALGVLALAVAILLGIRAVEGGLKLELLPRPSGAVSAPPASIWMEQDFEGALARAKAEQKFVLVDTYAEWCAQCKELDEKTWPDPAVKGWINAHAVAVRIDADKVRPDIAKRFGIAGFPTVLILDAEGQERQRAMGFLPPGEMLAFLRSGEPRS